MKAFMDEDFLLTTEAARKLYHDYAAGMPIIDYHSHLPPAEISGDIKYRNLAHVWLGGDHYKWRALRSNGIDEDFITGNAPDKEKFDAWARTVPYLIGNPLYHWAHLELRRWFGLKDVVLSPETADSVYNVCSGMLADDAFSARGLMKKMNVRAVCTTDDPVDDLKHHLAVNSDPAFNVSVFPTFRPDKVLKVENPAEWKAYIESLAEAANMSITSFQDLVEALQKRHDYFHEAGCRLSDHGLPRPYYADVTPAEAEAICSKLLSAKKTEPWEAEKFKTAVLLEAGRMNAEKGWTMQLHLGAIRNNNTRMYRKLGPDSGFDSIGDSHVATRLSLFLDALAVENHLPKTILYTLNPADNEVLGSMLGNFQDGSVPGKIQFGSAWWFNDHIEGMRRHMISLGNLGLLRRFVGMLTDSRSFLSFPRHEYFRRILCDLVGGWVENGEAPNDMGLLGGMVRDVCYNNARDYFGLAIKNP